MAQGTIVRKSREGIPCSPKSLKEHYEAFTLVEESINELYKKRTSVPVTTASKRARTSSSSRSKGTKNTKVR